MDILSHDVVEKIYTEEMVKQCLSAGWGPITYRQNTELTIAAWHWNPNGTWRDVANRCGYFKGSAELGESIRHSYGYPLPRRGTTRNNGAEHGYSRLTDGDAVSPESENPYPWRSSYGRGGCGASAVGGIDLGAREKVSHVRIDWHHPYARSYEVQYWSGAKAKSKAKKKEIENVPAQNPMEAPTSGAWNAFPEGVVTDGKGGTVTLQRGSAPIAARPRIWTG